MPLPVVIAKNQTVGDIPLTRLGLIVPGSGQTTLTDYAYFFEVGSDESLNTAVAAADIVINDGTSDLSTAEALAYLDATGNLNGPVTGAAAGKILRLLDTTGRYTEAAGGKVYDPAAVDPAVPVPADGDLYYNTVLNMLMYYDGARSKWLSVDSNTLQTGNNGNTPVGTYFRGVAGNLLGAAAGYTSHFNGTVVGVSWTRGDADATNFQLMASGVQVGSVASASTSGHANNVDADFNQGDILAVRNDAAGNAVSDAQVWLWIKWRI